MKKQAIRAKGDYLLERLDDLLLIPGNNINCGDVISASKSLLDNLTTMQSKIDNYKDDLQLELKSKINSTAQKSTNSSKNLLIKNSYKYSNKSNQLTKEKLDTKVKDFKNSKDNTTINDKYNNNLNKPYSYLQNSDQIQNSELNNLKKNLKNLDLIDQKFQRTKVEDNTLTSSSSEGNKYTESKIILPDINKNKSPFKESLNIKNAVSKIVNQVVLEEKDKMLANSSNKIQDQINHFKNISSLSNKLSKKPIKAKKKGKSKKDLFLTDIEVLQFEKEKEIKLKEENIYSSKNAQSEYLKRQDEKINEIFKYIDESDNDVTKDLNINIQEDESDFIKKDKIMLKEMFAQLDEIKRLSREKEDELQALIRITKQTTKNLDKHFEGINDLYSKTGIRKKEDKTIDEVSDDDEYSSYKGKKTTSNYNDDPEVLAKNLNLIKDKLLNVTGGVVSYHRNLEDHISTLRKNNDKIRPTSSKNNNKGN